MGVELLYSSVKTEVKTVESEFEFQLESRCGRESHTRPKGLGALMNWGPEKMLIRCSKESQHPAEWTPGPPVEHQENKNDTTLTAISLGSKYFSYVRSPALSHTQTLSNPFRTLAIKWEVHIFVKEVFLRLFIIVSLLCCMYVDMNQKILQYYHHVPLFLLTILEKRAKHVGNYW